MEKSAARSLGLILQLHFCRQLHLAAEILAHGGEGGRGTMPLHAPVGMTEPKTQEIDYPDGFVT